MTIQYINDGLHKIIFEAILADPYDSEGSWATANQLKDSPLIWLLGKSKEVIRIPASRMAFAFDGQLKHSILERATYRGFPDAIVEKRFHMDVLGKDISGQVDFYENGELYDLKSTSVFTLAWRSRENDWEKQLNILAALMRENGQFVNKLFVLPMAKDWRDKEHKDGRIKNYPSGVFPPTIEIPIWPHEKALGYIWERVRLFIDCEKQNHATCSEEDRWYNASKKKSARCEKYCNFASICPQRKKELELRDAEADIALGGE